MHKVAFVLNLWVSKQVSALAAVPPIDELPFVVIAIRLFHYPEPMDHIRKHLSSVDNPRAVPLDPGQLSFPVHLRLHESPYKMTLVSPLENTEPFDLTLDKAASVNEHSLRGKPLFAAITGDFVVDKRAAQL